MGWRHLTPKAFSPLAFARPGFPVDLGGVDEPHAAFLTESRTRLARPRESRSGTTLIPFSWQP